MEKFSRKCIVLDIYRSGERAARIDVLSHEVGREFFTAHGFWGSSKRFRGVDIFCLVELGLSRGKRGVSLSSSFVLDHFDNIRADITSFALASCDVEWIKAFVRRGEGAEFFHLLYSALSRLDKGGNKFNHVLVWLHFLRAAGFAPSLFSCSVCGAGLEKSGVVFSKYDGFFLCKKCSIGKAGITDVPAGVLRTLQTASRSPMENLWRIKLSRDFFVVAKDVLISLGEHYSGRRFKTAAFLNEVFFSGDGK